MKSLQAFASVLRDALAEEGNQPIYIAGLLLMCEMAEKMDVEKGQLEELEKKCSKTLAVYCEASNAKSIAHDAWRNAFNALDLYVIQTRKETGK